MTPLSIVYFVGAAVLLTYTATAVKTGRARFEFWMDDRRTKPFSFWTTIILYLLLSAGFVYTGIQEMHAAV